MSYKNPLVNSPSGNFKYLKLDSFIDFYFDYTHGLKVLPEKESEVWGVIADGSSWVMHLGKFNQDGTKLTVGINELNERVSEIKKITSKEFPTCTGENLEDFVLLTLSTIELDSYLPGGMLNFMEEKYVDDYKSLKGRLEDGIATGNADRNEWERLESIAASFYHEVGNVYYTHRDLVPDIPHITDIFRNKNIRLVNGEYDYKRINAIFKKELAKGKSYGILSVAIMLDKLLALDQEINETIQTSVERGRHLESLIADLYRKLGYKITETPATSDFGIDLIAKSNSGLVGIQCKNYTGNVGVEAVMQAHSGALYYDCKSSVVVASSGFTKAAYEMANKLNVELLVLRQ